MKNRFTIINFVGGLAYTLIIIFLFWPVCSDNYCHALIWTDNTETNIFSAAFFGIIFLIPFAMSLHGIYMYIRGYGESKFGQKETYDLNATEDRKKKLLHSSIASLFINIIILSVVYYSFVILLR